MPLSHPIAAYDDCDAAARARVIVAGRSRCNWMTDANANHSIDELFSAQGVKVESWTLTNANSTPALVPRQSLTLALNADGTGSFKGIAAANVSAVNVVRDVTEVTEAIVWQRHPQNPNVILISWPDNAAKQTLPGHFSITGFSVSPSTGAAPNVRKLAIILQDGVFFAGQYYGVGFSDNVRHLNKAGVENGIGLLQYEVSRLYNEGGFQ